MHIVTFANGLSAIYMLSIPNIIVFYLLKTNIYVKL